MEIDKKEIDSPQTEPQSAFKLCFEFQVVAKARSLEGDLWPSGQSILTVEQSPSCTPSLPALPSTLPALPSTLPVEY